MHPALILIPAVGLIVGPRLWARRVLEQHDGEVELPLSARELARDLLDWAASLAGVLNLWPWLGRAPVALVADGEPAPADTRPTDKTTRRQPRQHLTPAAKALPRGELEKTLRRYAKPLIRRWLLTFPDAQH